jgi:glycosyltransferase involved in cell wall biosynthesis
MNHRRIGVLHAVTASLSTALLGGQLEYLEARGFDPALLCGPGPEIEEIRNRKMPAVFTLAMQREISPVGDLKSLFQIWRLLRRIRPVICNSGTPKAGFLVGMGAWLAGVPCRVYTLRGLRLETTTGFKRKILTITERVSCFCAHRVVCVSPSLRERAVALGLLPAQKTVLLGSGSSNGVDPGRFAPSPERMNLAAALRLRLGIRPDQSVIGFVGRFTRDKGLPELLAAFQLVREKVPESVLLLVGDYEEGDPIPQKTRDAISSQSGVFCVGFSWQIELYYLVMNIFVLPTHREGFPNTILEAQAAGLPVVTTHATGAVDSIQEGVTGLLAPVGDSRKLAETVLSLLRDPIKMRLMGQLGRERVVREFRNEIIWAALSSLYQDMLQERGYSLPSASHVESVQCAPTQ